MAVTFRLPAPTSKQIKGCASSADFLMITSLRLPLPVYFCLLLLLLLRSDFAGCEHYEFNDPFHIRSTRECNVLDYGAVGDGVRYDTAAIQTAINVCASDGGGRVLLPSGRRYLTGTIYLTSGVTLVVAKGATLLGSPRRRDYPADSRQWYVILAEDAYEVGITGGGIIDGQGSEFVERFDERKNVMVSWNETGSTCEGDECRPRLVGFVNCRNVRVWDVRLMNPAYWWKYRNRKTRGRKEAGGSVAFSISGRRPRLSFPSPAVGLT